MTTLQDTWDQFETFREAFRTAAQWDPEHLTEITAADVANFPNEAGSPRLSELGPDAFSVLAFVSFLRTALADYESVDALIDDLRRIARADDQIADSAFEAIAPAIPPLIPSSPEHARRIIRRDVAESVGPVLVDVTGSVDLRAVPDRQATNVRFVPLAHLRLNFDEAVTGGADVVVFQATPSMLDTLEAEIKRLRHLFELAHEAVGESVL